MPYYIDKIMSLVNTLKISHYSIGIIICLIAAILILIQATNSSGAFAVFGYIMFGVTVFYTISTGIRLKNTWYS
jgi:preprotein translocase subunit SecG